MRKWSDSEKEMFRINEKNGHSRTQNHKSIQGRRLTYGVSISMDPLVLRPCPEPFTFTEKWVDSYWNQRGVYIWTIEHRGSYLASYAGQCFRGGSNFDSRIWQEYRWWKSGEDWPVDVDQYKQGVRVELPKPQSSEHTEREVSELAPLFRLWLIPLLTQDECNQAERWVVAQLCNHPITRQFLANRNPEGYRPLPDWPVQIDASPAFRVLGLNVPVEACLGHTD